MSWSLTFVLITHVVSSVLVRVTVIRLRRLAHAIDHGVVSVSFDMLLEILRTLERLATELASMWFQGHMHSDV